MSDHPQHFLELAMNTARQAAEIGAAVAMSYFQGPLQADFKDDASPVTIADRAAELALIEQIQKTFPEHSILAEESGVLSRDPAARWIIDPIDGTRGFIRGGSFWGTLVALEYAGQIVAGAICMPVLKTCFWAAQGLGCYRNGARVQLSAIDSLSQATLSLGELQHLLAGRDGPVVTELIQSVGSSRCLGDPGGVMMVLEGMAEVWLEAGVKPWDLAAAKILIEEAGGCFSNFSGTDSLDEGNAIVGNRACHEQVLGRIQTARRRVSASRHER